MCEATQQVNFFIDEAASAGKGANATISYVHYYFAHHGLGETDVHLKWPLLSIVHLSILIIRKFQSHVDGIWPYIIMFLVFYCSLLI